MAIDVSRIVTMNPVLLKDLPLEEVLAVHPLLDAQAFPYGQARKVKPIKARPLNTILDKSQPSVWDKMLLATLEGSQALKRDAFVCWGVNNDVWQQTHKKLHDKYAPTETDVDGWTTFVPKEGDDSVMNAYQVMENGFGSVFGQHGGFSIINPWWGDERLCPREILEAAGIINLERCGLKDGDMVKLYLHYGVQGDWVLQNRKDPQDTYRVAQSFFEATYEV
jgi:hypothetical protein